MSNHNDNSKTHDFSKKEYIYTAKGFGIILVLLFHYGPSIWWPEYYQIAGSIVYKFHMPLFMFLSGFLFYKERQIDISFWQNYKITLKKKTLRLLLPYISISFLYIVLKLSMQSFFSYHPVNATSLLNIIIKPTSGVASILWFIYALYIIFLFFPIAKTILKNDILLILLSSLLFFFEVTDYFILNRLFRFFPIFVYGYMFRKYALFEKSNVLICIIISWLLFIVISIIDKNTFMGTPGIISMLGGISGSVGCIYVSILINKISLIKYFKKWGENSDKIYLMHQPIVWFIPVILHNKFQVSSDMLMIGVLFALFLGLLIPIYIYKIIISRSNLLSLLILGIKK